MFTEARSATSSVWAGGGGGVERTVMIGKGHEVVICSVRNTLS